MRKILLVFKRFFSQFPCFLIRTVLNNHFLTKLLQVLDGIQYLHWRGLCHLDLQPDNVVMASLRSVQVKLVDLGSAHRVTKLGTKVPVVGHQDYVGTTFLSKLWQLFCTNLFDSSGDFGRGTGVPANRHLVGRCPGLCNVVRNGSVPRQRRKRVQTEYVVRSVPVRTLVPRSVARSHPIHYVTV